MITVNTKDTTVSNNALRRQGLIPAIIFSKTKNEQVTITQREFQKARQSHEPVLKTNTGDMVVIKEVQQDPVSQKVLHVSFQHIAKGQKFTQQVPLKLVHPNGNFSNKGLHLQTLHSTVEVEGTAETMVDHVTLDVSHLNVHDVVRVKDLPKLNGVTYLDDEDVEVAVLNYVHTEVTETPTETPVEETKKEA